MSVVERRSKLIDAAIAVMCREGVSNTTTRAITSEAGMPVGAFHYCFFSKEELVLEVIRAITERAVESVTEALTSNEDPEQMIRGVVDAYWTQVRTAPLEHLLSFELTQYALRQPGQRQAAIDQYARYYGSMESVLNSMAKTAQIEWRTPTPELSRLVLALIEGTTFQWVVDEDPAAAQRLFDQVVALLRREAGLDSS
jgi:AcrR family transcriptional regulator